MRLSEDEIAEFLINTERKENKITQNIFLHGWIYFLRSMGKKKIDFISWNCAEKEAKV